MAYLYHITSNETAIKIKESRKFWLTNYAKQNSSGDAFVWKLALCHAIKCGINNNHTFPYINKICTALGLNTYNNVLYTNQEEYFSSPELHSYIAGKLWPDSPVVYTISFVRSLDNPVLFERYGRGAPAYLFVSESAITKLAQSYDCDLVDIIYWDYQNTEIFNMWVDNWLKEEFNKFTDCHIESGKCGPLACRHSLVCCGLDGILNRLQWSLCGIVKDTRSPSKDNNSLKLDYADWSVEKEVRLLVRFDEFGADISSGNFNQYMTMERAKRLVERAHGQRRKIIFFDYAEIDYDDMEIKIVLNPFH